MDIKDVNELVRFQGERLAKVNLFETPRFFCDLYCLRPGQAQQVHSHASEDKVYHVLRGEVDATIGAETRRLRPGNTVLAAAGEPHGVLNPTAAEAVLLVFMAPHPDH
jgi:quercetin dioxygenase-like cupin family protein